MGMFLNYQNLADNYIPNNLINTYPHNISNSKLNPVDASKPYEEYDAKGELSGYFWHYGETLNLEFQLDGEITLESDAILLKSAGQTPTEQTVGKIGQRVYNIIDLRSWTCVAVVDEKHTWQEDSEFTYPLNSDRSVYISAEDYLSDKQVEVTIYNFRMEPVVQKIYNGSSVIVFHIDKKLSALLQKGIYYCKVTLFNSDVSQVVFDTSDCNLIVK